MKKLTLIVFLLSSFALKISAQSSNEIDENSDFRERIFTGGNFGLSFGSGNTYIEIAPLVGYRITNEFSAGGGFSYRYRNVKLTNNQEFSTTDYGLNLFTRYNVYDPFFAMAEVEYLNYEIPFTNGESIRDSASSFLVGGGVSQPFGGRASMNFIVLYNLSYQNPLPNAPPGPYDSPWVIRGGISLGF